MILTFLLHFSQMPAPPKTKSKSPRGFLPRPLLRAENSVEVLPNPFPQKIVLAKPSPHLNSASFSPQGETRPSPHPAHTEKRKSKSRENKRSMGRVWRGRTRHSRSGETLLPQCLGAEAVAWRNSLPHSVLKIGSNLVQ